MWCSSRGRGPVDSPLGKVSGAKVGCWEERQAKRLSACPMPFEGKLPSPGLPPTRRGCGLTPSPSPSPPPIPIASPPHRLPPPSPSPLPLIQVPLGLSSLHPPPPPPLVSRHMWTTGVDVSIGLGLDNDRQSPVGNQPSAQQVGACKLQRNPPHPSPTFFYGTTAPRLETPPPRPKDCRDGCPPDSAAPRRADDCSEGAAGWPRPKHP